MRKERKGEGEIVQEGRRTDAREMISNFLTDELAELRVKHNTKRLITTPREIAKHTGFSVNVVKKCLSMIAGRSGSARVVVLKVGDTDVVVRLTD